MSIFVKVRARRKSTGSKLTRLFNVFLNDDGRWVGITTDCLLVNHPVNIEDDHDAEVMAAVEMGSFVKTELGTDWDVVSMTIPKARFDSLERRLYRR